MSEACEEAESDQGRSTRAMSPDGGALEQSDPSRLGDGGAGGDPQLAQYVCHMAVDGVLADREAFGNLLVAHASRDQPQNLQLPPAERMGAPFVGLHRLT